MALPVRLDLNGHHLRLAEQHRLEGPVLEDMALEHGQVLKPGLTICANKFDWLNMIT